MSRTSSRSAAGEQNTAREQRHERNEHRLVHRTQLGELRRVIGGAASAHAQRRPIRGNGEAAAEEQCDRDERSSPRPG